MRMTARQQQQQLPMHEHETAASRNDVEMLLRVARVEQQMDRLPLTWKQFAGTPMHMSCFGTRINTFRENPALQPTAAYVQCSPRAAAALCRVRCCAHT